MTSPVARLPSHSRLNRLRSAPPWLLMAALLAGAAAAPGSYAPASRVCALADARITESSGLASSSRSDEVFFTHNDSGDEPRVFAVGRNGETLTTLTVPGAANLDWEDIARGPDDHGTSCLYIGDIGDIVPLAGWLAGAGQRILQLLPINEMAPGHQSPYSAMSAMAIDPIFIRVGEVEEFVANGGEDSLSDEDRRGLDTARRAPRIEYGLVRRAKRHALSADAGLPDRPRALRTRATFVPHRLHDRDDGTDA